MKRRMSRRQARSLYTVGMKHMPHRPGLGLLIIIAAFGIYLAQDYFTRPAGPIEEVVFTARVVKVSDGDTITVRTEDRREAKIRLYGIDAPEIGQPYGQEARVFLNDLLANQVVGVERQDLDQYGRVVARIFLDGEPVDKLMVDQGLAWVYDRYCNRLWCSDLMRRQSAARKKKTGLWQSARPTPPWVWRRNKS